MRADLVERAKSGDREAFGQLAGAEVERLWVVEVGDGKRLQLLAESRYFDAGAQLDQEILQIVDSIQFE